MAKSAIKDSKGETSRPCPCGSRRLEIRCHGPLVADAYAVEPNECLVRIPRGVSDSQADQLAKSIGGIWPYTALVDHDRRWLVRGAGPVQMLREEPLFLDPGVPRTDVSTGLLKGLTHWPKSEAASEEAISAAKQRVLARSHDRTPEYLHELRKDIIMLLRRANEQALLAALPEIISVFKTACPRGTADIVRISASAIADPSLIRFFAQLESSPFEVVLERHRAGIPNEGPAYILLDPEPFFELFENLCYPRCSGFGLRFGSEVYLAFDYGDEVYIEPTDWNERRARDLGASLYHNKNESTFAPKGLPKIDLETRRFLRAWLTHRLNHVFASLSLINGVPSADGTVDATLLWQDLLTIRDAIELSQVAVTSADPTVMRVCAFGVMDRLAQLGDTRGKIGSRLTSEWIEEVAQSIDAELGDVGVAAGDYLRQAWQRLVDGIWEGLYEDKVRAVGQIAIESPGGIAVVHEKATFAPKMLEVLRDTTHGYRLRGNRAFERFIVRHRCKLPSAVREVILGLWFGFLSKPELFWRGQRFRGVRRISP